MNVGDRAAKLEGGTWRSDKNIKVTSDQQSFGTLKEAEAKANEVAASTTEDAIIVQENGQYHVYGTEEIRDKFQKWGDNTLKGAAAGTVELVMTDSEDDVTVRAAGTIDKSAKVDTLTSGFKKAGFSAKEAYEITKHGLTSEQLDQTIAKLRGTLNSSNGLEGMKVMQARHLLNMLEEFKSQSPSHVSSAEMAASLYEGDAITGQPY
jgi:hypothetical protein